MAGFSGPEIRNNNLVSYYDPFNSTYTNNRLVRNIYNPNQVLNLFGPIVQANYIQVNNDNLLNIDFNTVGDSGSFEFQIVRESDFSNANVFAKGIVDTLEFTPSNSLLFSLGWSTEEELAFSFFINGKKIKDIVSEETVSTPSGQNVKIKNSSNNIFKLGFIRYYDIKLTDLDFIKNSHALIRRKF
jgi:hypothetical protein